VAAIPAAAALCRASPVRRRRFGRPAQARVFHSAAAAFGEIVCAAPRCRHRVETTSPTNPVPTASVRLESATAWPPLPAGGSTRTAGPALGRFILHRRRRQFGTNVTIRGREHGPGPRHACRPGKFVPAAQKASGWAPAIRPPSAGGKRDRPAGRQSSSAAAPHHAAQRPCRSAALAVARLRALRASGRGFDCSKCPLVEPRQDRPERIDRPPVGIGRRRFRPRFICPGPICPECRPPPDTRIGAQLF